MPKPVNHMPQQISDEDKQIANRLITETDWKKFWSDVTERASVQIDAYEIARVKSMKPAAQSVFT